MLRWVAGPKYLLRIGYQQNPRCAAGSERAGGWEPSARFSASAGTATKAINSTCCHIEVGMLRWVAGLKYLQWVRHQQNARCAAPMRPFGALGQRTTQPQGDTYKVLRWVDAPRTPAARRAVNELVGWEPSARFCYSGKL
ncbi:MAG: hypothetical protein D6730_07265 [Bacteroidetes bacterium]|nr:MAG: hypothetical protein D6730_07265 [Bacteroidota bacterium]